MARLTTIVLLLSLCSESFCCNSGWHFYEGICYTVPQIMYPITTAKRYCQIAGGQLAYVNSTNTLQFLNTVPNFNGVNEYWVEETSSLTDSTSTDPSKNNSEEHKQRQENGCPYVKILKLYYSYCSEAEEKEKKFFICEATTPKNSNVCPTGFDYYSGSNCYRAVIGAPANFEDATKFCILQKSRLAILDTEDKEWAAKSAIVGKNQTFLVSAKKDDEVLKWTNEKNFSPILDTFVDDSEGDCLGFLSEDERPLIFSWAHVNCSIPNAYLCETDPLPPKEVESTTLTYTTMISVLECPHGYNWKAHEDSGYCFWETTYETERLNWFQARNFCKLYGGDLASYDNLEQESIGLGGARGHYRGLWFGLKRDENDVFHWVDGSWLNFTNWDYNEPNLSSKTKLCASHSSGSAKWELDYCGVRRWFICKAPKMRNPVIPDSPSDKKTRCDIKSLSVHRSEWYEFEDHCYLIQEHGKYTWDTARNFCQDNEAHMISIHSFEETNFILSTITGYPDANFWTGLSAHGLQSSFEWTDNSPQDFIYWSDNKSEVKDFNTCVSFNKRDGSWDVDNCNLLQGVICKRGLNSSYDFTTTEPTATILGNCENEWYNLGNKCYKFFGNLWSQRLTWASASEECSKLGASLVSVHNKDEQDLLTDIVLEGYTDVWIGLRGIDGGTIFHWSDESRMDYTNWNSNEPEFHSDIDLFMGSRSVELCVEMEYAENIIGKWNDISCTEKKAYICQKMKDPTNTEPYLDPSICPNMTGWYKLASSCYGFFEDYNMTWLDAQKECKKYGANLVTYRNLAVSIFVKRKLKNRNDFFWIGVREKMPNTYEYITGKSLFYTNWMVDQPQAASGVFDNCVATTADGEWLVKSCKEKRPFICKTNVVDLEPEPEIDRTHTCRDASGDWNDYGGNYCYLFEIGMRKTWVDSLHYCFKHGGYLASFHSADEINTVKRSLIYYSKPPRMHIGLGRKKDGSFAWVDNTPVDFTNWDEDEPNSSTEKECVEMDMSNGKWKNIDCDENFRGFICSSPKIRIPSEESLTSNNTSEEYDIVRTKLTIGGIFGIVICILVVLAIIGMVVYYLKPAKEVKPKLLDHDNL